MTAHEYRRPPRNLHAPRELPIIDREKVARAAFRMLAPQVEMVPPQPVECVPKRGFWNPKQVGEMGDSELRNRAAQLEKTDKIISVISIGLLGADIAAYTSYNVTETIINGMRQDGSLNGVDIAMLAVTGTMVFLLLLSRATLADEKGDCYKELLKRADAEKAK